MPETYTIDELAQMLQVVVNGIRTGDNGDDRVYSLTEVAARTGFAERQLTLDCRAGLIEHTRRGSFRGMTSRQIAILVGRHAEGGDLAHRVKRTAAESGLAQALEMTRQSGAKRATPRKQQDAA
ncbi:hypothetical protein [Paractinoplanes maris]|uniref:hypothetical protein n=1 Tax=Paractinoplanes maris TaxID=1734446 RepID=UPI0020222374|nr:hypothetical protein [Actinoplanes maris]